MSATTEAFTDELLKIAYGMREAERVLAWAKKFKLPKPASSIIGEKGHVFAGVPPPRQRVRDYEYGKKLYKKMGVPDEMLEDVLSSLVNQPYTSMSKKLGRPAIVGSPRNLANMVESVVGGKDLANRMRALGPRDKKMLNSISTGHEADEAMSPVLQGFSQMGHRNPKVILREHNKVTTLPPEHAAVRGVMQGVRQSAGESAVLKRIGINYGEGQRLSRHAIRRLSDAIDRKATKEMVDASRGLFT